MKKIVIGLIGCGVVAGIVAYKLYQNQKEINIKNDDTSYTPSSSVDNELYENEISRTVSAKQSSIDDISKRHREAAEIMRNSVENIFSDEEKQGHYKDELDDISDGLDDILKEID